MDLKWTVFGIGVYLMGAMGGYAIRTPPDTPPRENCELLKPTTTTNTEIWFCSAGVFIHAPQENVSVPVQGRQLQEESFPAKAPGRISSKSSELWTLRQASYPGSVPAGAKGYRF